MRINYFLGFRKIVLCGLAAMMLLFAGCATKSATAPPAGAKAPEPVFIERQTAEGIVVGGINKENNTQSWKGILYAKPPVGELRWKETQAPDKRPASLKTTAFSNVCPLYIDHDRNQNTHWVIQGNEDYLYLNIWQPWSNAKSTPKTILLDADLENIKIEMSNKELTNPDIEKALRAEPRRKEIKPFWDNSPFRTDTKHLKPIFCRFSCAARTAQEKPLKT